MDRLINYLFIFALVGIFVLDAGTTMHQQIVSGAFLAALFCLAAFLLNWLSLDGARAGVVFGTLVFGLGGVGATFLVLIFFLSSTLITGRNMLIVEATSYNYSEQPRRDGLQVWSNGFWFSFFLMLGSVFTTELFRIAAAGALATATADTWATELGSKRFRVRTYLLSGLEEVNSGTDGGISVPGTLAALAGSVVIAFFAIYIFSLNTGAFFIIFAAGFSGCLADSYFGAAFQRIHKTIYLPLFYGGITKTIDNNMVNWMATGAGSLIAIILKLVCT